MLQLQLTPSVFSPLVAASNMKKLKLQLPSADVSWRRQRLIGGGVLLPFVTSRRAHSPHF